MMLDWAVISAIGTIVGGVSTLAVAALTVFLWQENRLLRKAGSEPKVVAHFELHPDGTGGLNLALSNVGAGPAFDVSFSFEKEAGDFENYNIIVDYATERPAMTIVEQGEKISFLFAVGYHLFSPKTPSESKRLKPFFVKVNWRTALGNKQLSEKYRLDVSVYAGLPGMINKPHLMRIADELSEIGKQLSRLTSHTGTSAQFLDATKPEQETRNVVKGNAPIGEEPS